MPKIHKIRIDYLNIHKECLHIFTTTDAVWYQLWEILDEWATDIFIYKIQ